MFSLPSSVISRISCSRYPPAPGNVPGATVNRLCGSGMEAVASAARAIRSGDMSLAIAGGIESMSRAGTVRINRLARQRAEY